MLDHSLLTQSPSTDAYYAQETKSYHSDAYILHDGAISLFYALHSMHSIQYILNYLVQYCLISFFIFCTIFLF